MLPIRDSLYKYFVNLYIEHTYKDIEHIYLVSWNDMNKYHKTVPVNIYY